MVVLLVQNSGPVEVKLNQFGQFFESKKPTLGLATKAESGCEQQLPVEDFVKRIEQGKRTDQEAKGKGNKRTSKKLPLAH